MDFPDSWKLLMQLLADRDLNSPPPSLQAIGAESLRSRQALLEICTTDSAQFEIQIAFIALLRSFLSILPASVIEHPEKPCRAVVHARLAHLLGEAPPASEFNLVFKIIKRMQLYFFLGRQDAGSTSFDLSKESHQQLLKRQSHRCACCGYRFLDSDLDQFVLDGASSIDTPISLFDRSCTELRRKAQLDHIIPIYLGGDSPGNWQVLCETCNSGKSDKIFGFEDRAWFGGVRYDDFLGVPPSLFFVVLKEKPRCFDCNRGVAQVELRVIRKDKYGADVLTNLTAACTDCIRQRF
jgi:5-methylcytosine-specific restriction endonuclease McrA